MPERSKPSHGETPIDSCFRLRCNAETIIPPHPCCQIWSRLFWQVFVQEGGYDLEGVGEAVANTMLGFCDPAGSLPNEYGVAVAAAVAAAPSDGAPAPDSAAGGGGASSSDVAVETAAAVADGVAGAPVATLRHASSLIDLQLTE
jgi:hypothetical protein